MKLLKKRTGLALITGLCMSLTAFGEEAAKPVSTAPAKGDKPAATMQFPGMPAPKPMPINPPDAVLVKIDDRTITQADLDKEIGEIKTMMKRRGNNDEQISMMLPMFRPQILDGVVTRILMENACAAKKIVVSSDELQKEIEKVKASLPKSITMDKMLKQNGLTQEMLENDIKEQLKLQKLLNVSEPTDDEIKAYYNEKKEKFFDVPETVHARHILIKFDEAGTDDAAKKAAKQKIEGVLKQVKDGGDFEKLAKDNSDCPSREQGGDLGTFRRGQMVPEFEKSAFGLKTNEISGIIETQFGYHIIQTLEHNLPKTMTLDETRNQIVAMIKGKKTQELAEPMLKSLREKAKITYQNGAEPVKPMGETPVDVQATDAGDAKDSKVTEGIAKPAPKADDKPNAK